MKKWWLIIREKLNNICIQKQIFYSLVGTSLLCVVFLGITIYYISKDTIETNYRNAHTYNLQVSSNIIDTQLRYVVETGRSLLENNNFLEIMEQTTSNTPYFSSYNQIQINNILNDTTSHNGLIDGIAIINNQGSWQYTSKRNSNSGLLQHYYTTDNILEQEFIEAAKGAKGKEVFFGYNVLIPEAMSDTISYVKQVFNPTTRKPVGYLIVVIRKNLFTQAFGTSREGYQSNRYMVVDASEDAQLIYISDNIKKKEQLIKAYTKEATSKTYLFSSYYNSLTHWQIVNVVEKKELSHDSSYIRWVIMVCCFLLFGLSFVFSRLISNRISKPLQILEKSIIDVSGGNRHIEENFDNSEIGVIGKKFKEMVNNNLELRERLLNSELKEREAELLLLQAQINPHFLYNTLDSLYFMAIIKNDDEFAEMVLALSNTFKLSLNKGDKFITVRDELFRMKEYMKIQNMRYNNRFTFYLEVEEEIENIKILTFILQPFVENAMYHGLETKIGEGFIKVKGVRKNNDLCFTIQDNGAGIKDIKTLENGYGVQNVKERIRLFYGENYGISFVSELQVGTTVNIVIPIKDGV